MAHRSTTVFARTFRISTPAANTAATITMAAISGEWRIAEAICFSYDSAPTGGSITISDGDTTKTTYVTQQGAGYLPGVHESVQGKALTITLAAGGAGVKGAIHCNELL